MRVACLWLGLILVLAAGCRPPLPPPPDAGAVDDAGSPPDFTMVPLPNCTKAPDCYACCAGIYPSGAEDFDGAGSGCACKGSPCAGACAGSVCGMQLGVSAACLACIDGASVDGGACQGDIEECLETDGACGAFKSCAESCAGTGTP